MYCRAGCYWKVKLHVFTFRMVSLITKLEGGFSIGENLHASTKSWSYAPELKHTVSALSDRCRHSTAAAAAAAARDEGKR